MNAENEARIGFARERVERGLAADMDSALAQVDEIKQCLLAKRKRVDQRLQGWDKPLEVFENFREFMLLHEAQEEFIVAAWEVFVARGLIQPIVSELQS
jgi:hypothetical protein